jgi:hypothetical protein
MRQAKRTNSKGEDAEQILARIKTRVEDLQLNTAYDVLCELDLIKGDIEDLKQISNNIEAEDYDDF